VRAKIDTPRPDDLEPDAVLKPYGRNLNAFSLDAGMTLKIIENLGIAVVGYNLTNVRSFRSALAPIMLGMSAFFQVAILTVSFDVLLDFVTPKELWDSDRKVAPRYMVGAEVFLADHWPLRAGYAFSDVSGSHSVHAGLGYIGRKGSLETGFSYEVNGGLDDLRDLRLVVSLKYFAF
jgi:opacity protein-like surface antigen